MPAHWSRQRRIIPLQQTVRPPPQQTRTRALLRGIYRLVQLPHCLGIGTLGGLLLQVLAIIAKDPIRRYFMLVVLAQAPLLLAILLPVYGVSNPAFLLSQVL